MDENESIEFKEKYTENIYKEIISFLNTKSGWKWSKYKIWEILEKIFNCHTEALVYCPYGS